jgi:penicillin amidase
MLRRHACAAGILLLLFAGSYLANVVFGLHAASQVAGTVNGLGLERPVSISRDARGIPHIRAFTLHDLFFTQGFAEASDRLFEMEVTRRYAYGRLAEVFGAKALGIDENMRAADISEIAAREWEGADARTRRALQAFSDGVNAAERRQPLPVEFRMLLYRPQPWSPRDSIAVSLVAALELGDSWYDVLARDAQWRALSRRCFDLQFPLSDPRYDVTVDGRMLHGRGLGVPGDCDDVVALAPGAAHRPRIGSNAWAAGALRTTMHRALIANDPHVDLTIPGIWYAIDLQAPGFHAAGAVVPGLPGVILGHNERVAWAVTNAEVATSAVYRVPSPPQRFRVVERFAVRFGTPVTKVYYRTKDAFSINADDEQTTFFVRWPAYQQRSSTIPTLLALDRASNISAAMRALSAYRGAPQNFIVADTSGAIAYHLAGAIYDDPAWGRYVHPAEDLRSPLRLIAFSDLPARAPSDAAVLMTANNRVYGPGYRYRL